MAFRLPASFDCRAMRPGGQTRIIKSMSKNTNTGPRPVRRKKEKQAKSIQAVSSAGQQAAGQTALPGDVQPGGRKIAPKAKRVYGWPVTLGLFVLLLFMIACLWALFISGPARIHDEEIARVQEAIKQEVPEIQGLQEAEFEYVTWQGYTDEELYWFDSTGSIITTRELSTLNYNEARAKAASDYGMDVRTAFVAYGYSGPVYQLESENRILMLDYDTLDWVYERGTDNAGA